MKKLVFVLISALVLVGCQGVDDDRMKIGVVAPLSGGGALLGENTLEGIELYMDEHPDFRASTNVIVEDATTINVGQGVSAVKKLVDIDKVDVLLMEMSSVAMATADFIDQKKIPTIAAVGADAAENREYMVRLWVTNENEMRVIVDHIDSEGLYSVALVTDEQESMTARTEKLKELISSDRIVYESNVNDVEGLGVVAIKIAEFNPDVVAMHLMPGKNGMFAKKLRELGYKGQLAATLGASTTNEMEASQGALVGVIYPDSVGVEWFEKLYMEKYGSRPGVGVNLGYDAMKLIDQAMEGVGDFRDKGVMNEALRVRGFQGAMGDYSFSFDELNTYLVPAELKKFEKTES